MMKPLWMKKLVKTIFGSVIKNRYKPIILRTLGMELLESRLTPTTVSVDPNDCGNLLITGTSGVDNPYIFLSNNILTIVEASGAEPGFGFIGSGLSGSAFGNPTVGLPALNNIFYDRLVIPFSTFNFAGQNFNKITVNLGDGRDILNLGIDPLNSFSTSGLDFTSLNNVLSSQFVLVNFNGDTPDTTDTTGGINTLNMGGITSSYNADLNINNFDFITNYDAAGAPITIRASQGSLLIANPISPIITIGDGLIPPNEGNNSQGFNFEASGNGNRIIINNQLNSLGEFLYMGAAQIGNIPGTDEIIIKSIAPNSSINPLTNSILGGALTISTQGDVYFQGNISVGTFRVLDSNNFIVNGDLSALEVDFTSLSNFTIPNGRVKTPVVSFNKNVNVDNDFTINNLGSTTQAGAQFYINKDALDFGTADLTLDVGCNFNAININITATATSSLASNSVTTITPILNGSGYTNIPIVTIAAPPAGGTQATAIAVLGTGLTADQVVSYIITNPGSGYTSAPTITVAPSAGKYDLSILGQTAIVGQNININNIGALTLGTVSNTKNVFATATSTVSATGTLASINPVIFGSGYTSPPTVTVEDPVIGATATARAFIGGGSISFIFPQTFGLGYTTPPLVTITGGGGTGADFTANVVAGRVTSYTQISAGTGYTSRPTVTVAPPPPGVTATADAILGTGATADQVIGYTITNPGSGYAIAPRITVASSPSVLNASITSTIGFFQASNINSDTATTLSTPLNLFMDIKAALDISTNRNIFVKAASGVPAGTEDRNFILQSVNGDVSLAGSITMEDYVFLGASASAILSGGSLSAITPVSLGSGYVSTPLVTIAAPTNGGIRATATAVLGTGAQAGQIVSYLITNPGTGYSTFPIITVAAPSPSTPVEGSNLTLWSGVSAPTFGTSAVAGVPTILNGQVLAIPVTTIGEGYSVTPVVNIIGGGGFGATAIANVIPSIPLVDITSPFTTATARALTDVNGVITSIVVVGGGSGYLTAPTVTIAGGGGTGATATSTIGPVTVIAVNPSNTGFGYTSVPTVNIIGGGGTGATAIAILGTGATADQVVGYTITNPGTGYTFDPTVIIFGGGGTGATAEASAGGFVTIITVTAGGTGYSNLSFANPIVVTIADPALAATATAVLGTGLQSGQVVNLRITASGSRYTIAPTVTIAAPPGSGTQATATAILSAAGRVTGFTITDPGSGYLPALINITVTNPGTGYTSPPTVTFSDPEGDVSIQTVTGPNRTLTINDAKTFNAYGTIQVKNLVLEALNDPNTFSVGEYVFNANIGLTNNPTAIAAMAGLYNIQFLGSINVFGGGATPDSFSNSGQILLGNNSTDTFAFNSAVIFGQNTTVAGIATVIGNSTIQGNLTPGQVFGTGLPSASAILVSSAGAIATVSAGGRVTALVPVVTGYGYAVAPTVTIAPPSSPGGITATATAVLGSGTTAGQVVRYIITNSGTGYTSAPTVTIAAPSGTGQLSAILPINFGSGYTVAPAVIVSGGGGTGASATAILGTGIRAGQVVDYVITNPGAGYTSAPTISFSSVGILTFTSPLVFDNVSSNSTYSPVIIGNKIGLNQSQVIAQAGYTLTGNPRLSPSLGSLTATPGTAFTILNQISGISSGKFSGLTDPVTNTYSILNEGDIFYAGNATYKISYTGGTGSSVVITFIRDTTGGNNFTAEVYYNSGVIEVLVTSTGIDVDATILSVFNTSANIITFDAGAGNTIQFADLTSGNLNVSSGNSQTATIGLNNNIVLGLKLLGNVGQDKFIIQDLNSKVLLNSAATFGVDVDTSSYSGGEYQDTLTVDGTVKVFGTGNFKTSNNNPVQNLDEIIITSSGVVQSVGSGDILLVANHGPTSNISISSPLVSLVSPIVLTAAANAVLVSGTLNSLTRAILGSGYTSAPAVSITGGGGTGATATAVLGTGATAGQVVNYNITNPGSGYTSVPTVNVAPPTSLSTFSLDLASTNLLPSGSVTLLAGQNISMGGNVVRTNGGSITFASAVNLTKDSYLTTGNNKADVTFSSTIDENFDLTIKSFGSLNFQGNVGSLAHLGDITTQSVTGLNIIGFFNGSSVPVSINAASFNTAGGVNGNIVFSGTQNYSTLSGLNLASIKRNTTATDSGANGDITLNGAVSLISGAVLNLAHEGALNINANITNGLFTELLSSSSAVVNFGGQNPVTIFSDADITFNSPVNLGIDTNLQSTNNFGITFNNTLNGANDLAINTTGSLVFTGAVGATAPLNSISTKFRGVNSTTTNNPLQLDVNNTLKVGSFEAMVNGDINMIQDQTYTGNGLTLVTVAPTSTIRLGKIIGDVSSSANVSISNAGALILNNDIKLGGSFSQGALFTGITLTNAGSNYTSVPSVSILGGGGSGATATAALGINAINTQATATATINATGSINQINVPLSGSGYTSPPTVIISAPTGNTATASTTIGDTFSPTGVPVLGGLINLFPVLSGSGYTSLPTVTISAPPVGGTQATAVAIVPSSGLQAGQVIGYTITDAGSGYVSPPTVTVSPPPTTAATAIAVLGSGLTTGQVVSYIITFAGSGYTSPPSISVSAPPNLGIASTGSGYVVGDLVTLRGSSGTPANAQISNVNANGGITGLTLLSPGKYTGSGSSLVGLTVISTTGRGSGGTVNASGFVESVTLTSAGSGYTSVPTISFSVSGGVRATALANLTSPTGQVYIGNLGNPSTLTIKTGIDFDFTFTGKTYLNQNLLLDGSSSTKSDVTFGAIEGGALSLLPALTIVAGGKLIFNGSIGAASPLGAIDASANILTSVQSTSTCLGINAASLKFSATGVDFSDTGVDFSATGVVSLTAPQHYTGTKLADGSVFGLDLTNTTSSSLVTLGDITTREFFNTQVGSVNIDNAGNGYTTAPTVNFPGGGGSGAAGLAFLGISDSTAVITSGGSGYTLNQIVQIVQLGFNNQIIGSAIGQVTGVDVINNGIVSLSILSFGYGFTDLTNLSVISSGFGGIGSGATISATGFITAVDIISGGIGYTTAPAVLIDRPISGTQAGATAVLAKKSNSVTISNAGPVTFQGDINIRGNFNQIGQGAVTIGTTNSGTINLNSVGGDVFFNTAVVQLQNFVLDSSIISANSGDITFNNSIDSIGFKAITLNSGVLGQQYQGGKILLRGSLGISPMGNIQVNNSNDFSVIGNIIGNSLVVNSAKGAVNFSGAITIRGTVPVGTNTVSLSMETISSASSVVFQNPVITAGNVIIKNAGTFVTTSIADMSIQGSFQQTGAGVSSISGDISTTVGGINFAGPVGLSGTPKFIAKNTVSITSLVDITFQNDVNGLGGISLDTTGRILFLGNIGLLSPLSSIEIVNANYTNPLDLVAVQFNSSASQVTNANKIILPESTGSSNLNGRVIFNGSTNISNAFTTTRSYYDIFFNSNVTFSTNTNFLNGGKVKFSGTTNFTGSATFNNSGTLEASGIIVSGGSLIVQRPLAITNNLQLYLSSSNNSFTSSVSGNSIVTINSGGTLVLTGNSPQFTGNFVVNTSTINGINSPSTLQVSAFYNNATVTLNGGTLSGTGRVLNVLSATNATAIAVVGTGANAGKIRSISVTNPGSGYVSPPTVTIAASPAGGTRATATAILGTGAFVGQIVGFSITNSGSGYTFAPSVTVSLPTAGGTFSPGAVLGNLTVGNQLVLGANNTFTTSINGVSPGTFGQTTIISGGSFGINNANLAIVLNTNLTAGNQIPLVNLGGGSSSLGNFTFNGTALIQGASFSISSNGYTNTFTISYTGGDGNDIVLTVSGSTASAPPPGSFTASQVIGVDYGGGSVVQINYTNGTNLSFFAYSPSYTGGVRVALGDVNGDGIDELITGTGVGGGPHIKVFNLQGGQPVEVASFFAFEPTFMGGVNISTGDINGDGLADIIVGAGAGGGPRVKVFNGAANYFVNATKPLMDFFVYDPAFTGGVTVAAGNRDGYKGDEVITGSGFGGGPNIRSFNQFGQMVDNFFAFNSSITSGVFVAAGYVDADAIADIIAGTGFGTPTQVAAFFSTGANPTAIPFVPNFVGGARVGVVMNSSGKQVFAAAAGPGGAAQVNIFNNSLDTTNAFIAIDSLFSGGLFLNTSIYAARPSLPNR